MKINLLCMLFFLCAWPCAAQESNLLQNPSFEGDPSEAAVPDAWLSCGTVLPDLQPGICKVNLLPNDGLSYCALMVSDSGGTTALCQALPGDGLAQGGRYHLEIYLARSEMYMKQQDDGSGILIVVPIKLRVWGSNTPKERGELLAESGMVTHTDWRKYSFDLAPADNTWKYFVLEAMYLENRSFDYNGHLMIDQCLLEDQATGEK
jgi:hypothetical protein